MQNNLQDKLLSKLKPLVNNKDQWDSFSDYINFLIAQNHAVMEQTNELVILHRSQGAIMMLRRLRQLRDSVNANGKT
ncbi:hypothetical protein [uncultured virus]|uniref:Uncharacterized protein n=1 Tax=uncultured virus TaxID=340016 RepID=A0A218MLG7_9VIRU|nr:hypothetical protein [uncultured virus]